jgi:hypothetical protein
VNGLELAVVEAQAARIAELEARIVALEAGLREALHRGSLGSFWASDIARLRSLLTPTKEPTMPTTKTDRYIVVPAGEARRVAAERVVLCSIDDAEEV